jgi:hypothetical protein
MLTKSQNAILNKLPLNKNNEQPFNHLAGFDKLRKNITKNKVPFAQYKLPLLDLVIARKQLKQLENDVIDFTIPFAELREKQKNTQQKKLNDIINNSKRLILKMSNPEAYAKIFPNYSK